MAEGNGEIKEVIDNFEEEVKKITKGRRKKMMIREILFLMKHGGVVLNQKKKNFLNLKKEMN